MAGTASRADPVRARKLAEQCFAVARSTKFDGERTAAIAKGEAIAKGAGLSLDQFDIPGRSKPSAAGAQPNGQRGPDSPARPWDADIDETLRRAKETRQDWFRDDWFRQTSEQAFRNFRESMDRARERTGARDGETPYDAARRNFDAETAAADERDRAAGRKGSAAMNRELLRRVDLKDRWPSVDAVINALRARRVDVTPINSKVTIDGDTLRLWVVFQPTIAVLDQWSLRELADEVVR